MKFLKPAEITALYLFFLYLLAVLLKGNDFFYSEALRLILIGASFIAPTLALVVLRKHKIQWDNILITLFIILLLADTFISPALAIGLGVATFAFKMFARVQRHPVFNPAAASLSLMYFFGITTTWWGVSFSPRFSVFDISTAIFITIPLGLYVIWKYKKLPTLIATTIGVVVMFFLLEGELPTRLLLEGTFAFFLLIMATEPKTTPLLDKQEWVYGALLGISLPIWFYFKLPLPYLLNLVILNILFTAFKLIQTRKTSQPETKNNSIYATKI